LTDEQREFVFNCDSTDKLAMFGRASLVARDSVRLWIKRTTKNKQLTLIRQHKDCFYEKEIEREREREKEKRKDSDDVCVKLN
jgi:hypothetical protein